MYSAVLMAAMATAGGPETPSFGLFRCARVCSGCACACSCYGGGCYGGGCFGSCFGCRGCYGCYSAWGGYCHGCAGSACYCSCGGWGPGCWGTYSYSASIPYLYAPAPPAPEAAPKPRTEGTGTSARLSIEVPDGAKLFIDDQLMKSNTALRQFVTPRLEGGRSYYYEVRVEATVNGKPASETQKIIVRAGDDIRATFTNLGAEPATVVTRR